MFDFVRSHNRLLQGLLVLLIFPSFVFFGVQGYSSFTADAAATVAKVDGHAIKQSELDAAHRQQVERMRQQMPNVDLKLFDTPEMKRQTLDALVRERVLLAALNKQHLDLPDERVQQLFVADPQFAMLRKPDGSVNSEMLAAQGMNADQLLVQLRQEYGLRQVLAGVNESALAGKLVLEDGVKALLDQREVQLQRFDAKDYLAKISPTDAEIEAYYKGHSSRYRAPESAAIEYVVLDLAALKQQVSVSDDQLKEYYKQNEARYTVAEERRASHILIAAAKDAPAAERAKAKEKAQALLAEVRKNPAAFAEIAKKNSNDPGSAEKGGDLDFFARGAMVKPFEDAAFSMKPGDISEVVESDFGYHIIKLTDKRGGTVKPFEAVRAEILDEVTRQQAQQKYAAAAEDFSNTVEDQSDTLQPVVDKLKLTKLSATVQRTPLPGAAGPLASAKLLEAVFGHDATQNKRNTQAIETGPNQLVAARVTAYHPEQVQPLETVRAQVLGDLSKEQAAAAARKEGEALLAALKQNPANALPQTLTLSRTLQNPMVTRPMLDAALRADLSKGPAITGVDLGAEGYAVLKVLKSVPRAAADADMARAQPYVSQALVAAESAAYFEALKRRYKVDIKLPAPAAAASAATDAN